MEVHQHHDTWVQVVDERTGNVYFHNTKTGRSQWKDPFPSVSLCEDRKPSPQSVQGRSVKDQSLETPEDDHSSEIPISLQTENENKSDRLQGDSTQWEDHVYSSRECTLPEESSLQYDEQTDIPSDDGTWSSDRSSQSDQHSPLVMNVVGKQPSSRIGAQRPEMDNEPLQTKPQLTRAGSAIFNRIQKLERPVHTRSRSVVFSNEVKVQSYPAAESKTQTNVTVTSLQVGGHHRRSKTSNSLWCSEKATTESVPLRKSHRRSRTNTSFTVDESFLEDLKNRSNVLSTIKDRRCWGRPERARTQSEDFNVEMDDLDGGMRFRTTSSADPLVIARLSGMTDPLGVSQKRFSATDGHCSDSDEGAYSENAHQSDEAKKPHSVGARGRANTTSTMFVTSTMAHPDGDAQMRCVSAAVYAHMVQALLSNKKSTHDPRFSVFDDDYAEDSESDDGNVGLFPSSVPNTTSIHFFIKKVYDSAQMEKECIIMTLIYLERLLKATKGRLHINARNWQSIILSSMILSSKVWDDLSMWNADFSLICPRFTLKRINELEVALLEAMKFNVRVSSSAYAKYYFQLRSMESKLGVEGDESDARPLDLAAAFQLETISEQNIQKLDLAEALQQGGASVIRRRSNTLFGGASREWIQDLHENGYRYTPESLASTASIEQVVSMEAPPLLKDPW